MACLAGDQDNGQPESQSTQGQCELFIYYITVPSSFLFISKVFRQIYFIFINFIRQKITLFKKGRQFTINLTVILVYIFDRTNKSANVQNKNVNIKGLFYTRSRSRGSAYKRMYIIII